MNIYSIPPFIISILIACVGVFSFVKNMKRSANRAFFILCISVTLWLFFSSIAYNIKSHILADYFMRISYLGIIFIPAAVFHFIVCLLDIIKLRKIILFYYFLSFIFVFFVMFTKIFITGVQLYFWGYYPKAGFLHPFFLVYILFTITYCNLITISSFLKASTSGVRKQQIKYIFLAFFFLTFALFDFIPNYGISFYPFGYIPTAFFIGIFTYCIIRYRLLNVRTVITRTAIFIIVYSFVLGIPFFIAVALKPIFVSFLKDNWWIFPLLLSTFLATTGPFIYLYVDKKAEDRLLKEQKSYQNVLSGASSGMIRIKDLKRLLNLVVHVVTKAVRLKHASIYLLDRENNRFLLQAVRGKKDNSNADHFIDVGSPLVWSLSSKRESLVAEEAIMQFRGDVRNISLGKLVEQLVSLDAALVVPSFVDNDLIGILILGEKLSKKLYSQDDINVFSVLANQAALAIENAQFYNEIKQTHEQLFQAEKLATIGTMADGLSHQINNRFHALSLISGDALDILKTFDMSSCTEETRQVLSDLKGALERIESNVLQGGEVVKGLLKYSRPGDSGFEKIDLRDVVSGAIDMVQYKIKLKDIDLVQNIPADLPKLHGNLTQLQEVFFNLIDNAYDATKERQVSLKELGYRGRIEIAASGIDGYLEIKVSDNGIGVKDQDRKKLFTPFFTTKATSRKGTGLGLYVIDKIIKAHNGKIEIESAYQSSTRFTIVLPILQKFKFQEAV